jgi:hypothetical protein
MSRQKLIVVCFVLLLFLHEDFWWKSDPRLVFGILPVSLAYHIVWTLLVAVGWFLVARFCWPAGLDGDPALRSNAAEKTGGKPS